MIPLFEDGNLKRIENLEKKLEKCKKEIKLNKNLKEKQEKIITCLAEDIKNQNKENKEIKERLGKEIDRRIELEWNLENVRKCLERESSVRKRENLEVRMAYEKEIEEMKEKHRKEMATIIKEKDRLYKKMVKLKKENGGKIRKRELVRLPEGKYWRKDNNI